MSVGAHKKVQAAVSSHIHRRRARLTVDVTLNNGAYVNDLDTNCKLFPPDGGVDGVDHPCRQVAPGRYEVDFEMDRYGAFYRLLLNPSNYELKGVYAFNEPYPQEYRRLREEPEVLQHLAKSTGGASEAPATEILAFPPPPRLTREIWHWFLILGLLLLPVDILCKRDL